MSVWPKRDTWMQLSPVLRALLGPGQSWGIPEASLAWLQKEADISYGEKGKSPSCCLVVPEIGAKRDGRQISMGSRELGGEGLRVSPGLWPHGPLAWWLPFSARLASSSQMLRIPIFCVPTRGSFPGKGGERCTGNFEGAKTLSFQSSSRSFMRERARPGFGAVSCLPLWIHLSSCSGSAWFCYTYRLFCLLASC